MMDDLLEEMIDPEPPRAEVMRRRRLWTTGGILTLAAVGVASLTTAAVFTDQDTSSGSITSGTLQLAAAQSVAFDVPTEGLAPGGTTWAPLTVENRGSLHLRYGISLRADATDPADPMPSPPSDVTPAALTDVLRLRVYVSATCDASVDGTEPVADSAALLGGGATFGLPTGATPVPVLGSPGDAQDPAGTGGLADERGLAGASGTEALCLRVDMDPAAGNEYQNRAADVALTFSSEQTVNNGGALAGPSPVDG